MIAIIDYGAGNLFSVKNALDFLSVRSVITDSPDEIKKADKLILPGVGAFPDAMEMLKKKGMTEIIKEEAEKKPLLGICLGMQILFEKGYEFKETEGLGLIKGEVKKLKTEFKIPHMGYNELEINHSCPLLNGISEGDSVYFVHSFMAETDEKFVSAYADYGVKVPALVFNNNVFGAQFHPEKSGSVGLKILDNFAKL